MEEREQLTLLHDRAVVPLFEVPIGVEAHLSRLQVAACRSGATGIGWRPGCRAWDWATARWHTCTDSGRSGRVGRSASTMCSVIAR